VGKDNKRDMEVEKMDKKRAVELLMECVDEIPKLKTLHYNNVEFTLWKRKVENIIRTGLDPDDNSKFWSASQSLDIIQGLYDDSIYQEEYKRKITNYEIALKSIILKHEILGTIEKSAKGTDLGNAVNIPIQLFDAMQLHPRVVKASKSLFANGHYAQATFEAFKAVENFVREKSGSTLYGKQLMTTAFNEDKPIIQVPEAGHFDKDVQEGFKFLFMGGTLGIRNPKAHQEVIQKDPFITLEYLGFASFLIKRIEEGKVVRTSQSRRKWDWDSFIKDTKNKCEQKIIDLTKNLYDFTSVNSDSISWGTGINDGSFTFRKLSINGEISIFSVYSCGWVYINFGSMINKTVPDSIIETFRTSLNSIPNINIPKSAITDGKYARIYENPLTNFNNLQTFKDAVTSLCQQLENN